VSDTISDVAYLEQRLGPRPTLQTWLTTWEAAEIAGVSRPYLLKLLDAGEVPFKQGDRRRRILCSDLIAYLRADDARREQAVGELARLGQEIEDGPLHGDYPCGRRTKEGTRRGACG
jgi:excisionase family DNA binding protein